MRVGEVLDRILEAARGDLPGQWAMAISDGHSDFFARNLALIRVEVRLSVVNRTYGAWLAVPLTEWMDEPLSGLAACDHFHRAFRPWERPDRGSFPYLILWPLVERLDRRLLRFRRRSRRRAF